MDTIKQNLYSRQIGTIGKETMKGLNEIRVLIIGLDSIGFEIAKCLCLMGVKQLYISDPRVVVIKNKFRNISLSNYSKKNNSEINSVEENSVTFLRKLNRYVDIKIDSFKIKTIKDSDIIIQTRLTKISSLTPIDINNICRKNKKIYILGTVIGLSGYIFNDFGINHIIKNYNGEKLKSCYVKSVKLCDEHFELKLDKYMDDNKFQKNDLFNISGIEYTFKIESVDNDRLYIRLKKDMPKNILELVNNNLFITEYKNPVSISYKSLKEICKSKSNYPDLTINIQNYDDVINLVEDFHELCLNPSLLGKEDSDFRYLFNTRLEFPIIGVIIGSIISGEIFKTGGKYQPINQECIIDYSELYSRKLLYKSLTNKKNRDVCGLLSKNTIKKINNMNVFIVGCGALGCEYLKCLSLINSSCGKGLVTVTDMDNIELSNLNRQFLFQENDIGKSKSLIACKKINDLGIKMKLKSFDLKVGENNESIFNRKFWENQDLVINALDNVIARQYVDSKCVLYDKPLFEAGTLGTKCNGQVIIPKLTKSYSDTNDPVEKSIPVCTVKNFPFKIEHCIEWSLEIFNKYFNEFILNIEQFSKGHDNFKKYIQKIDNENIIYSNLLNFKNFSKVLMNPNIHNLIIYTKGVFQKYFIDDITQLLHSFPSDKIADDGTFFWSGNRLLPKLIDFNQNVLMKNFMKLFIKLLCSSLTLKIDKIDETIDNCKIVFSEYTPKDTYKFKINDDDTTIQGDSETNLSEKINTILLFLSKVSINKLIKTNPIVLEKDNDLNNHIKFLNTISNIRATIYGIKNIEFLECKLIAGRITPALSTTTSLITSLMTMEIIKYITKKSEKTLNKLINFKDVFVNMGINTYIHSEPQKAIRTISGKFNNIYGCKIKAIPECFNTWDKIKISGKKNGIISIKDLKMYLYDEYEIDIDMLSFRDCILFNKTSNINKNHKFIDLYKKYNITTTEYLILNISSFNSDFVPIISPILVYSLYI